MSFASLDELRSHLGGGPVITPEYRAKMLHAVPVTTEVKREAFIVEHCRGKRVLEFGASGALHDQIFAVAAPVYAVDREDRGFTPSDQHPPDAVFGFDLDDVQQAKLPVFTPDIIICGEVLEHLGNPLWFLTRLRKQYAGVPVIISVPNAFSEAGRQWIKKGQENCNRDHVAWYSPQTLSVLLTRAGFAVGALYWYGGVGPTAEGFVVCTE